MNESKEFQLYPAILFFVYFAACIVIWIIFSKYVGDETSIEIVGASFGAAILIKCILHYFRDKLIFYKKLIKLKHPVFAYITVILLIIFSLFNNDIAELKRVTKMHEKGNNQATYDLAYMYKKGIGTPGNMAKACALFSLLVEEKNILSVRTDLGVMHKWNYCPGTRKENTTKAIKLLKANADKDDSWAMYELGIMLFNSKTYRGDGLYYLERSAKLGNEQAKKFLKQKGNREIIGNTITTLCKYETCDKVADYLVNEMK